MTRPLLLDTCTVLWIGNAVPLKGEVGAVIAAAIDRREALISPISAWEIGLHARPRPNRPQVLSFAPDPKTWFHRLLTTHRFVLAPFTADMAIDSSSLPGSIHLDPADRMLVSTARHLNAVLVTRDRPILAYAEQGYVQALAC